MSIENRFNKKKYIPGLTKTVEGHDVNILEVTESRIFGRVFFTDKMEWRSMDWSNDGKVSDDGRPDGYDLIEPEKPEVFISVRPNESIQSWQMIKDFLAPHENKNVVIRVVLEEVS